MQPRHKHLRAQHEGRSRRYDGFPICLTFSGSVPVGLLRVSLSVFLSVVCVPEDGLECEEAEGLLPLRRLGPVDEPTAVESKDDLNSHSHAGIRNARTCTASQPCSSYLSLLVSDSPERRVSQQDTRVDKRPDSRVRRSPTPGCCCVQPCLLSVGQRVEEAEHARAMRHWPRHL